MNKLTITLTLIFLTSVCTFAQKKQLGHDELISWNRIQNSQISNDGNWVTYSLKPEKGDAVLKVWNSKNNQTQTFERGEGAKISGDNQFVVFKIKPHQDTVTAMKRRKVKKNKMPKDSLGILNLATSDLVKIEDVKSFKLPEKWSGWVAYHKEIEKPDTTKAVVDTTQMESPDTTQTKKKKSKKGKKKRPKKEGKKTGTKLVFRDLASGKEEVVEFVMAYTMAEEGPRFLLNSTGKDSTFEEGVYLFDCEKEELKPIFVHKGEYKNMTFDKSGSQVAFHANLDTLEMLIAPYGLAYWKDGDETATILVDTTSQFLAEDWRVSESGRPSFSEDGSKLYFGVAPNPILQDTSLLEEEIVKVEVWSWTDDVLHTQQKNNLDQEKKRTYQVVWHTQENRLVQVGNMSVPEIQKGDEGNSDIVLGYNENPYIKSATWRGFPNPRDLYIVDLKTGKKKEIKKAVEGSGRLSPKAKYVTWFSAPDTAYFSYSIESEEIVQLTKNENVAFFNELHDSPSYPSSYGISGWTEDDKYVLINDRYDIWKFDPTGKERPVNLTQGRENQTRYRYIRLDPEARNINSNERQLLHVFNEKTKASGYGFLRMNTGKPVTILSGDFNYSTRPRKAKDTDKLMFTKQSFTVFPDILYSDFSFQNIKQVSEANPQQKDYSWGSGELYYWTDLNGNKLTGMLYKPENFDPLKKYPMLVNFYEKSSDRLHSYRAPSPGRSTINYSFYISRGYMIFNPDVPYREGYPGESCLNAVVSGVTSLIDKGFVDKERIGVQGHSWGGYQIAYLLTKTDIFKCAESGAPVVNMFSAYGGIRWGSGLSRMFQYEKTQSRIGGTIWDYPLRYLENSPIFFLDKVNTPVLIMHNDKDGAVPWYQGIEYFVGLRRLGKPAWMLNYNGDPHWAMKFQNRVDFNIRMQQYFDYYLMDAPKPKWMDRGVPAMEKGIDQGYELMKE
jgi:dipeptidyl aminopeptidase/acylaminoacyl peptidase